MFAFELKQVVALKESGEYGTVIGRSEYTHSDNAYLLRYKAGDGRCVEAWWTETALKAL